MGFLLGAAGAAGAGEAAGAAGAGGALSSLGSTLGNAASSVGSTIGQLTGINSMLAQADQGQVPAMGASGVKRMAAGGMGSAQSPTLSILMGQPPDQGSPRLADVLGRQGGV